MCKGPGNISADEKAAKRAIAALALFALTETLIDPPCPSIFAEGWRVIFTASDEFREIAALLEMDVETLQKNTRAYLQKMGVFCKKEKCH